MTGVQTCALPILILQSARKAQSEESRGQLRDAHNRVMSVAALQQQLATSQIGDVALQPYFAQLCDSIGPSMIQDHDQISLKVEVDDGLVDANTSISLGLLVTELVINCLKHAFPNGRKGQITVRYRHQGPAWTLEVEDDGNLVPLFGPPPLWLRIIASIAGLGGNRRRFPVQQRQLGEPGLRRRGRGEMQGLLRERNLDARFTQSLQDRQVEVRAHIELAFGRVADPEQQAEFQPVGTQPEQARRGRRVDETRIAPRPAAERGRLRPCAPRRRRSAA